MRILLSALGVVFLQVVAAVQASGTSWRACDEPDAKATLAKSRDAVKAAKSLTFVAVVEPATGSESPPSHTAEVSLQRVDAGGWAMHTKGSVIVKPAADDIKGKGKPGGKDLVTTGDGTVREFEFAYDGTSARSLRDADKAVVELSSTDLNDLKLFAMTQDAAGSLPWELLDTTPMPEPAGASVSSGGIERVRDVPCDVVVITGKSEGNLTLSTRYLIGTADHLPRKIERVRVTKVEPAAQKQNDKSGKAPGDNVGDKVADKAGGDVTTTQSLTLTDLKADEGLAGSMFVIAVPDGYMVKAAAQKKAVAKRDDRAPARDNAGRKAPPAERGLLALGSDAPSWSLKDAAGHDRKLSEFRGKVVVMDFWGTWCPWCVKAMPSIQKVHEKFKDKPVAVLGMNFENDPRADPQAFMKKHGFTYQVILKAETIAEKYQVHGWPTLYVIGPDGKILLAESGFNPQLEQSLTTAIEAGLKDTGL